MVSIKTRSRLNPDGTLDLHVPTGLPEAEVDVTVVVEPVAATRDQPPPRNLEWPPSFFERTFGSAPDLERAPQGEIDVREGAS